MGDPLNCWKHIIPLPPCYFSVFPNFKLHTNCPNWNKNFLITQRKMRKHTHPTFYSASVAQSRRGAAAAITATYGGNPTSPAATSGSTNHWERAQTMAGEFIGVQSLGRYETVQVPELAWLEIGRANYSDSEGELLAGIGVCEVVCDGRRQHCFLDGEFVEMVGDEMTRVNWKISLTLS